MPTYVYECRLCGHAFELDQRVEERDDPIADGCPQCNAEVPSLFRVCGNTGGFRLSPRGSVGWASDGYASTWGDAERFKAKQEGRQAEC